jgi:glycosyltransferase involved in cell wall biosynthesis
MPNISVIIPNYNHARYLNQRIDSVLNQTYQDFEVIILDDCSTDDSRNVIEEYRTHPRVSNVVFNKDNSGSTFKQWDKGLALAKGDYIWIAESDDYADSTFLESIIKLINNDSSVGIAYCGSNTVDENGEIIGELIRYEKNNHNGYYRNNGYMEVRDAFFSHPIIPNASAVVFKKENIHSVNEKFKNYKICGDWQFWIDISFNGDVIYIPEKLNYFRQSGTSVSRSNFYRKDNYKTFLLEKLKIALYVYERTEQGILFSNKIEYIENYLFEIILNTVRDRMVLKKGEWIFIVKSLLHLSLLTPLIFFKSLYRVLLFALRKIKRKLSPQVN